VPKNVTACGERDLSFYNILKAIEGGSWRGAMPDHPEDGAVLKVTCPCCEAILTIDPLQGAVVGSEKSAHARAGVDLKDAQRILDQESARIHERYDQIVQTEKGRGAVLDKLFKSHMEKSKDEPAPRPVRDIDLD